MKFYMDKDPEMQELAHRSLLRLAEGLVEAVKACGKLKEGQILDPEKSPAHIVSEIQGVINFC